MQVKTEIEYTSCDGCRKRLNPRNAFMDDGSFKVDWAVKGELAICPACAFEVFVKYYVEGTNEAELKEQLETVTRPFNASVSLVGAGFGITTEMATTRIVDGHADGSLIASVNNLH